MSGAVIEVRDLSFRYDETPTIDRVSFTIDHGDFVAIVGPNGAGKTTLAKLLLGLLQPASGSITILGRPPRRALGRIGYVPQYASFDPHFPILVKDVVLMGRLAKPVGFYGKADHAAAARALEEVGMEQLASRPFSALSGGQRQRILIARALAGEPAILVMDEPTTNVDAAAEERMRELLRKLNSRMTILLVTHDLGFVPDMVNKVLCVNVGAKLHDTREVTAEMIEELFHAKSRMIDHRHPHLHAHEARGFERGNGAAHG